MSAFREISLEALQRENEELRKKLEAYEKKEKEAKKQKVPWWKFWYKPPPPPTPGNWTFDPLTSSSVKETKEGKYRFIEICRKIGDRNETSTLVSMPGDKTWYWRDSGIPYKGSEIDCEFVFASSQLAIKLKSVLNEPSSANEEEPPKSILN